MDNSGGLSWTGQRGRIWLQTYASGGLKGKIKKIKHKDVSQMFRIEAMTTQCKE
jgi:hypothetical protein